MGSAASILGMDLGGTTLRLARVDGKGGKCLLVPTPRSSDAKAVMSSHIHELLSGTSAISLGLARAAGIDQNGIINEWPSRPEWIGIPLLDWLRDAIGRAPMYSADDGLCAALWEHHRHASIGQSETTACLSIGTGLAIGIMAGAELISSGDGANTLSHDQFGNLEFLCKCGRRGCLQTVLSVAGLERVAATGATEALCQALTSFFHAMKERYGVNRTIITGGGVNKFGARFLNEMLARSASASGVALDISSTPALSALGGALLLAARKVESHCSTWSARVQGFIQKESFRLAEA